MRRTRDQFRAHLFPGDSSEARQIQRSAEALSHPPSAPSTTVSAVEPMSEDRLAAFYKDMQRELKVLQRAAVTSMMYTGDRLVVEADPKNWTLRTHAEAEGEKST